MQSLNGRLAFALILLGAISCAKTTSVSETQKLKLFPPSEACSYPANSSVQKYRALAGGNWSYCCEMGSALVYDCGKGERFVRFPINPSNADDRILVEYGAVGPKEGADSVGFDYDVLSESPLAKEPEYRQDFVRLIDETTRQALRGTIPNALKEKMLDLKSFNKPKEGKADEVEIGDGKVRVSRHRSEDGNSILIKVQICADKTSKCL